MQKAGKKGEEKGFDTVDLHEGCQFQLDLLLDPFRVLHYNTRWRGQKVGDVTSTCLELVVPKRRGPPAFNFHVRMTAALIFLLFFFAKEEEGMDGQR